MTSDDTCVGCGRVLAPDDRFCGWCGLTRRSAAVGEAGAGPSEAPVSTIGAPAGTEPALRATSKSRTSARSLRAGALTAVVLAATGWSAWRLFQPPIEVLSEVAVTLNTIDARVPASWSQGPPGAPLIDLDVESLGERPSSSDGVPLPEVSGSDLPEIDAEQLIGLDDHWLIVSNQTHLVRLDPATGTADLHNPRGLVVGHDRGRLVTVNGAGRGIHSVSVVDPEDNRVLLREGDRSEIADLDLPGDGTLTVVLLRWAPDRRRDVEKPESLIIDLDSGETVRRVSSEVKRRPDVEFSPGYGSFEIGGDGEVRFLDEGFVEVAGDRVLLVQRCEDPDTCRRFWLDRQSGRPIDRLIPANPGGYGIDRVLGPDDRIVALHDHQSARWYFDTMTGTFLLGPANVSANSRFGLTPETVSPDGRYLIAPTDDGAIVHDLETGFSGLLAVDMPGWPIRVELVPKTDGG